jgi:hypothetical protein
VFLEPPTPPLAGMCAVDVDDATRSVTEFMIQLPRHLGTHLQDIASMAVFIEGHPVLARAVRGRITSRPRNPRALVTTRLARRERHPGPRA